MATTPREKRNELLGATLVKNLERRHFEAYYCPTAQEASEKILGLVPQGSSVSWGGSMTIRDMGLTATFHDGDYAVTDRDLGKNPEEVAALHREALLADYFITSTNALSEDGIFVNIDGTGNRLAAICFGPKNVIFVVGLNKVSPDLDSAIGRARSYAAPINSMRFLGKTPCATTGTCHNCTSLECICNQILVTRVCRPAGHIKVVLVGESFGF